MDEGSGTAPLTVDVLVVGSGFAGLGVDDSPERFYQDLLRAGQGRNNPVLARILAEHAQEALDWSRDEIGVEYLERLEIFGGHSVARCYTARGRSGNAILRPLLEKALALGVQVRYATSLEKLTVNAAGRKTLADALLAVGQPCVGLADNAAVLRAGWSLDRGLDKKVIRKFETLDALAGCYGIDRDALRRTAAASGKVSTPPFYAVRLWPKVHYTVGGLAINADAAVVDRDGHPLGGLFAAGEVAGGVHGASRLGSCSITECFVFGRIAGRSAAGQNNI